ncbi:MAG: FMN-binding protein [Deltaproteobacteria bacterium]|nr:FMN-binding protein [Deltaproteobacteria bacterium]
MKSHLFSIAYMFLLTLFFSSLVSAVKLLNEDRITRNQEVKLQRIVLQVLNIIPGAEDLTDEEIVRLFQERIRSIQVEGKSIYRGYKPDGETLIGYAFPVGGPGFWGPVEGMVAVDREASRILGLAFYRHNETPGLGARITEPWFREQFTGLPIYPVQGDRKIFYLKTGGAGQAPNELDAITGATGTSRALETFLNSDLDSFLKKTFNSIRRRG